MSESVLLWVVQFLLGIVLTFAVYYVREMKREMHEDNEKIHARINSIKADYLPRKEFDLVRISFEQKLDLVRSDLAQKIEEMGRTMREIAADVKSLLIARPSSRE